MNIQQAGYVATMPSRTEQSAVIASGAGAKTVTFAAPFFVGTSSITAVSYTHLTLPTTPNV